MALRVLHIVTRLAEGSGIAEAVIGLVGATGVRPRMACDVMTYWEPGLAPFVSRCLENNSAVHTVEVGWRHTMWFSRDWRTRLDQIAPAYDVLHIHGLWLYPNLISAYWCSRHRKPFVFSPHGALLPCALVQSRWKKFVFVPIVRWLFKKASCVHVTAKSECESVKQFFGDDCPPVASVAEGVEPPPHIGLNDHHSAEHVVTYLGRISPEKNVHALVDAWQSLEATARTGWILRLVGFPPKGQSRFADKLARRCESIPDIKVEPFCGLERKWDILLESDVVVLPSLTENFGIVVAEALACGIPVVATKGTPWEELLGNSASALVHYCESSLVENEQKSESGSQKSGVSDTHELARTGRAGWWVDISAEALAEALRQALILTDAERLKLGENGKALVSKKYRWPVIAAEMERVYEWAEGSGTQPSCVRHS